MHIKLVLVQCPWVLSFGQFFCLPVFHSQAVLRLEHRISLHQYTDDTQLYISPIHRWSPWRHAFAVFTLVLPKWSCLKQQRRRRFWHATQNYVAPYIDHILHRDQLWAIFIASGSVRLWNLRSCFMVLSHVMKGASSWSLVLWRESWQDLSGIIWAMRNSQKGSDVVIGLLQQVRNNTAQYVQPHLQFSNIAGTVMLSLTGLLLLGHSCLRRLQICSLPSVSSTSHLVMLTEDMA